MRFSTRTLKVTAWLSAATFTLLLVFGVASFWGAVLRIQHQSSGCNISRGELAIYSGVWHGTTSFDVFMPGAVSESAGPFQTPRWWTSDGHWLEGFYVVPLWLPAACSLAVGVPAFVTLRRRARALKNGACPKCGYMLTGVPLAAPCPECGRAPSTPS